MIQRYRLLDLGICRLIVGTAIVLIAIVVGGIRALM